MSPHPVTQVTKTGRITKSKGNVKYDYEILVNCGPWLSVTTPVVSRPVIGLSTGLSTTYKKVMFRLVPLGNDFFSVLRKCPRPGKDGEVEEGVVEGRESSRVV